MSIYDRDYIRERERPEFTSGWGVTQWLLALNVACFVLQQVAEDFTRPGYLWPRDVLHGAFWQLLTMAFLHGGLWHLLFNMLFLFQFGPALESLYGPRRFLKFYLLSGVVASLAYVAGALYHGERTPALGASGCLMGIMVLYAFHYPRQRMLFYGILPIEIRWLVVGYVLLDVSGYIHQGGGVANAAHLGGAACGAAYALWERRR